MAIRYYTENLAKIPFRLQYYLNRLSMPAPLALVIATWLWVHDRLGFRLTAQHGVALFGPQYPIDPSELPSRAVAKWAPLLEQLRDLEFTPIETQRTPTIGAKLQYSCALVQETTSTVAILEWIRLPGAGGFEESTTLEFNSYGDGGPDIVTGVMPAVHVPMSEMLKLETADIECLANTRPLAECYQKHLARREGRQCISLTEDTALRILDERNGLRLKEMLAEGHVRELTAEEIARLEQADVGDLHSC